MNKVKTLCIKVGLLGLEPRLFWTKTRRVASYTIGQLMNGKFNINLELHHLLKKFLIW